MPSFYHKKISPNKEPQTNLFHVKNKKQRLETFQKTIPNWIESNEKWDFNHPSAQKLHKSVFEMCIIDLKGWDEINSTGFQRVLQLANPKFQLASPKYYASQLDQSYEKVKLKLNDGLSIEN